MIKRFLILLLFTTSSCFAFAKETVPNAQKQSVQPPTLKAWTLKEIITFALKNNPKIIIAQKGVETEIYTIKAAAGARLPRIDFSTGFTHYLYAMPVTPIENFNPADMPEFSDNITQAGLSMRFPLYRGGRLVRDVQIAGLKKEIAQEAYHMSRQELIYNLTSLFYKIAQLRHLLEAHEASVSQLQAHQKNVELFLQAGTMPRVELLKTNVALAQAEQGALLVQNNIASSYELLKTLMGLDDLSENIEIVEEPSASKVIPSLDDSIQRALTQRPDYKTVFKKQKMAEETIKNAKGKRLPDIALSGDFAEQAGNEWTMDENWSVGLRLTVPVFEGGIITSEINKAKIEAQKVLAEERSVRLSIVREIRDAYLNIDNARERIEVNTKAVQAAKEVFRIEFLRYGTGAGTSTDVIDAQTALLKAETDFFQACYDLEIATAALQKAIGEDDYSEEETK